MTSNDPEIPPGAHEQDGASGVGQVVVAHGAHHTSDNGDGHGSLLAGLVQRARPVAKSRRGPAAEGSADVVVSTGGDPSEAQVDTAPQDATTINRTTINTTTIDPPQVQAFGAAAAPAADVAQVADPQVLASEGRIVPLPAIRRSWLPPGHRTDAPVVPAPTRSTFTPTVIPARQPPEVDQDDGVWPESATTPVAPRAVRSTTTTRRRRPRIRRVTRVIRHVDPWSMFKVALCFSTVLYGVALTAGVLLWNVAYTTGTIDNMERFFESFGWDTFEFKGGELYHEGWIAGLFVAVGLTGFVVLAATLFNLITDLVGGVRVTVLEEEVIERDPSPRGPLTLGRRARSLPAPLAADEGASDAAGSATTPATVEPTRHLFG